MGSSCHGAGLGWVCVMDVCRIDGCGRTRWVGFVMPLGGVGLGWGLVSWMYVECMYVEGQGGLDWVGGWCHGWMYVGQSGLGRGFVMDLMGLGVGVMDGCI